MTQSYSSPLAFRSALEARFRVTGPELERRRQSFVFERFLARLAPIFHDAVTLKGGVALELRIETARATKDLDLHVRGRIDDLAEQLLEAGRLDTGDFLQFDVAADAAHPTIDNDGVVYEGRRFRASCKLNGKLYGNPFGIDVGVADPMWGAPELVVGDDVLDFIGVPPPKIRVYPIATHIAEKLHAFTLPRERPNTRVKDLPDIALLATIGALDADDVRAAIRQTFTFRTTHGVPSSLPSPPPEWVPKYSRLALENRLTWPTLADVHASAASFLDPILDATTAPRTWSPSTWTWTWTSDTKHQQS